LAPKVADSPHQGVTQHPQAEYASHLGSTFSLYHADVVLALQIKPELRAVPKIAAEPHRCIGLI
jgi:hypothetical protein